MWHHWLLHFRLQAEVGINMLHRDYKLLSCRHNASKRENEAITQRTYLVLHPDRGGFKQWLMKEIITVDMTTCEEGKAKVVDNFQSMETHQGHAL